MWGVWDWVAWWFGFDVAETEVEEVEPDPRVEDRLSHVGEGVLERLRDLHASQETSLWALRGDAVWRDDSLIQTPNAWGFPASDLFRCRVYVPVSYFYDAELGLYRCDSQVDCLEVQVFAQPRRAGVSSRRVNNLYRSLRYFSRPSIHPYS